MSQSDFERKILRDNKSGSSEILNSVLIYNHQYLKENNQAPDALGHLLQFNKTVAGNFSAMAIITNGLNRLNHIISESISDNKSIVSVSNKLGQLIKDIAKIDRNIITNCADLFAKGKGKLTIATYSNSGLIKKVINHYRKKIKKIYLSEARPANEGREMAQFIADIGIEVILSVDALLPSLLSKVEFLLLGADSVGKDWFINKIGSELLLKSARRYGVKSTVIFESLKIKKINKNTDLKDDYDYREIWFRGNQNYVGSINQYFEIIDNRNVDGFISDLGVDTPKSLKERIKTENYFD